MVLEIDTLNVTDTRLPERLIATLAALPQTGKKPMRVEGFVTRSSIFRARSIYWVHRVDSSGIEIDMPPRSDVPHVIIDEGSQVLEARLTGEKITDLILCKPLEKDAGCRSHLPEVLRGFYSELAAGKSLTATSQELTELMLILSGKHPQMKWADDVSKPEEFSAQNNFRWSDDHAEHRLLPFEASRSAGVVRLCGAVYIPQDDGFGGTLYRVSGTVSPSTLEITLVKMGGSGFEFG